MRDPYDPWADERHADATTQAQHTAITNCTHCDTDGLRPNNTPCDHQDHAAAAQRGITAIRTQMSWPHPTTPDTPSS